MARNHVNNVPVRPDYFGPASYHPRRVNVGIRGVTARKARKKVASLPIGLFGMPADATFPRGVSRVDVADWKSNTRGFVSDLRLKIAEGPRVQNASLRPGSPYPCANAIEVFEGDTAQGVFGCGDDPLGNAMIYVCGEPALLKPASTKKSLRAFRALPLELAPEPVGPSAEAVQVGAGKIFTIARGRDVDDADIHTKPPENLLLFGVGHFDGNEEIELCAAQHEVGFAALVNQKRALVLAANEGDRLSTGEGPEIGRIGLPRQDARIVCDRSERSKSSPGLLVEFVRVSNFSCRAYDHLRRKFLENGPSVAIRELVQSELAKHFALPRLAGEPITHLVSATHRGQQRGRLLDRRSKLNLHNKLHRPGIARSSLEIRLTRRDFLPVVNDRISATEIR
jgi:hypothetical protein